MFKVPYEDLLGKQYKHNGRGPDFFDCWGLSMEIYRRLGLSLPEFLPEKPDPSVLDGVINDAKSIFGELASPEPYCLVTFIIRYPYVSHVGVILDNPGYFIHIREKTRVTVERLENWKRRVGGYYKKR